MTGTLSEKQAIAHLSSHLVNVIYQASYLLYTLALSVAMYMVAIIAFSSFLLALRALPNKIAASLIN
ncbi:hypothetical protein [Candidatus Coxiella mudrowiae]|uniref:hypothetical protein n=1 Tax=Candidatus Coxiella mudrowiae TaxID=2054173 RepID=UPI000662A940|nr:hypothetical protein [Candidatus Coxiella mudrowiae]